MGTTVKVSIQLKDFPKELELLSKTFNPGRFKAGFTNKAEKVMLDAVKENFAGAKDVESSPWKSTALKTKLGGRFAVSYKKQPSGTIVTASNVRLTDTGELQKSIKTIKSSFDRVVVGPTGDRNITIFNAAIKWKNIIGGFGKKQIKAINDIMINYLKRSAVRH